MLLYYTYTVLHWLLVALLDVEENEGLWRPYLWNAAALVVKLTPVRHGSRYPTGHRHPIFISKLNGNRSSTANISTRSISSLHRVTSTASFFLQRRHECRQLMKTSELTFYDGSVKNTCLSLNIHETGWTCFSFCVHVVLVPAMQHPIYPSSTPALLPNHPDAGSVSMARHAAHQ
ncbi:hypothetical protein CBL_05408 [Carabus blaptoides fortunei]